MCSTLHLYMKQISAQELLRILDRNPNVLVSVDFDHSRVDVSDDNKTCGILLRHVRKFDLPERIQTLLINEHLPYVWQLVVLSDKALCQIHNISTVSVVNIRAMLSKIPGLDSEIRDKFRYKFFVKLLSTDPKDIKRPKQELAMIKNLEPERLEEVEVFVQSFFGIK